MSESRNLNHKLTEQNQNLHRAHEDLELKGSELEKHNRALKEVSQPESELNVSRFTQHTDLWVMDVTEPETAAGI